MRRIPASSSEVSVPMTVAGKPPRASTQRLISSWSVVVCEEDEDARPRVVAELFADDFFADDFLAEVFVDVDRFAADVADGADFFADDFLADDFAEDVLLDDFFDGADFVAEDLFADDFF